MRIGTAEFLAMVFWCFLSFYHIEQGCYGGISQMSSWHAGILLLQRWNVWCVFHAFFPCMCGSDMGGLLRLDELFWRKLFDACGWIIIEELVFLLAVLKDYVKSFRNPEMLSCNLQLSTIIWMYSLNSFAQFRMWKMEVCRVTGIFSCPLLPWASNYVCAQNFANTFLTFLRSLSKTNRRNSGNLPFLLHNTQSTLQVTTTTKIDCNFI